MRGVLRRLQDPPRDGALDIVHEREAQAGEGQGGRPAVAQPDAQLGQPEILVGMRIAIGFGWTTLVAAEMVAANVGLGQMVLNASNFLRTDIVIMGIIVIGVVAYLFDLFMRWVESVLVPWKGRM